MAACKSTWPLPWGETLSLVCGTPTNLPSASEGATISSFQDCSTNVFEKIVGASAYKIRRNIRDSWRTVPNNSEYQASEISVVPWLGFLYPVGNGQMAFRLPTKSGIPWDSGSLPLVFEKTEVKTGKMMRINDREVHNYSSSICFFSLSLGKGLGH